MTITKCNDAALNALLDAEEEHLHSGDELAEVAQHVESCTQCQRRLSELVAEDRQWSEVEQVLSPGNQSVNACAESLNTRERWKRPTAWTASMAKSLLAPPSHPEMLGRIGRYDVERLIGGGGMGVVFKAYDTELNRPVAVKLLAPYLAESGSARKRFARESRAAAAIVDEHVVAIHNVELGDDPQQPPFLVMKYIAGGSLQQRLDRDGPLDVCEILRIGMQTAKGLAAAHAQGLIHRDVKPSNILLDEGVERALLTDFGLARAEDDACLTRSGFHPGTPHYMSPEQIRGEAIDGRSDLFSLGCVLYSLCAGHPPFRAETSYAVLRRITDDTARPIREINPDTPEWLEQIVMNLLSKLPGDRFDSAEQVAELLEDCLAHVQHPTTIPLPKSLEQLSQLLPSPQSGGSGRKQLRRLFYIGFAAFWLIFAGVLIVLETNKGTLRIKCDTDDIPIRIMRGNEVVKQLTVSQPGTSTRIAAGEYVVEIDQTLDGAIVDGREVSLKRGDVETVNITLVDATNERGSQKPNDTKPRQTKSEQATLPQPKFATPEILMRHFADCQLRGDTVGCIDCYSDEVINGFAASYLMTAMIVRGDMFPGEPNKKHLKRDAKQQQSMDELETLLKDAIIENPPAIASAALLQAAGSYLQVADSEKRDALTNDQLALIATSPTILKHPRQFVKDFAKWSKAGEYERSKQASKQRQYRIEYEGDLVWAVNIEDNSRMGLKRFGDKWLIHAPWSSTVEEAALSDDLRSDATGDESTRKKAANESDRSESP